MIIKTILTIFAIVAYFSLLYLLFRVVEIFTLMDCIEEYNKSATDDLKIEIPNNIKDKFKLSRDIKKVWLYAKYHIIAKTLIAIKERENDEEKV